MFKPPYILVDNNELPPEQKIVIKHTTIFFAPDYVDANKVIDGITDSMWDVVCPSNKTIKIVCTNCEGTLVNSAVENTDSPEEDEEDVTMQPGQPCWVCAEGKTPGFEETCSRVHYESAMTEERNKQAQRKLAKLEKIERTIAELNFGDKESALEYLEAQKLDIEMDIGLLGYDVVRGEAKN